MNRSPLGRAPDYTNAALAMGLVNLVWLFVLLWIVWGWPSVMLTALALNWGIDRLDRHLRRRDS